ncbi:MAG: hypothetical protein WDN28_13510 [Chthoniobacter sp.]
MPMPAGLRSSAGVHREAEVHFREALRLDPDFDYAREGLLSSFRARSPLYRAYLKYTFAMARLNRGARWAVILGLYFGVKVARYLPGGVVLVALYFLFVLWVWVARPVGNTLLLFDRFARYALRPSEKIEAAVVTGCLVTGLTSVILSFALDWDLAMLFGIAAIAIAFPLSLVFTNASILGRWVFGGIAAGAALVIVCGLVLGSHLFADLFVGACIACGRQHLAGQHPRPQQARLIAPPKIGKEAQPRSRSHRPVARAPKKQTGREAAPPGSHACGAGMWRVVGRSVCFASKAGWPPPLFRPPKVGTRRRGILTSLFFRRSRYGLGWLPCSASLLSSAATPAPASRAPHRSPHESPRPPSAAQYSPPRPRESPIPRAATHCTPPKPHPHADRECAPSIPHPPADAATRQNNSHSRPPETSPASPPAPDFPA